MKIAVKTLKMPSFGADMQTGILTEWLVSSGDHVQRGDVIALIETDKGTIEMDTWESGQVAHLLVEEGVQLDVGTAILELEVDTLEGEQAAIPADKQADDKQEEEEQASKEGDATPAVPVSAMSAMSAPATVSVSPSQPHGVEASKAASDFVMASPRARRAARQHKINLQALKGSGQGGSILFRDLPLQQADVYSVQPEPEPAVLMQQAIAQVVTDAKRTIPHYYLSMEMDVSPVVAYLSQYNAELPPERWLLLPALLYCAIARCIAHHSALNGVYEKGRFLPMEAINMAVAISLRNGGLVTPTIHNVDQLTPDQAMEKLQDLVERARHGQLKTSELQGAGFTVSNIGDRGADQLLGIIYPPQVALIGIGRVRTQPWVVDEQIVCREIVTISVSADHRCSNGHQGARFLYQLAQWLQQPEKLWIKTASEHSS